MSKIKLTSYVNFILYIALILSPILTIAMGVLCHFVAETDDNIIPLLESNISYLARNTTIPLDYKVLR